MIYVHDRRVTLTTLAGLSSAAALLLATEPPLMAGLSSRPLPRGLPPGVVRGEDAMLGVSIGDSMSVKKGCRLAPPRRGEVYSGTPLLLAGLDCLQAIVDADKNKVEMTTKQSTYIAGPCTCKCCSYAV